MALNSDPFIGQQLGDYTIESLLGQGGMARVYRAVDPNLNRVVAIKVIDPGVVEDPEYTRRFKREAQTVAKLNHPNIVSLYQFGLSGTVYFMAMAFIDGVDLDWLINDYGHDSHNMGYPDLLRIITQVASALDYAHGQGVIHRDIKPGNILLNRQGRAFLTDFGLVRDMAIPTLGEIFGSPKYMSPEQAINSANAVPQSDLYSLGIVLYEMVTGHVPFSGGHPNDIALMHIEEPPPSPRQFNPSLSPALEAIILKLLEKRPEDRFQTGAEVVNKLRLALK
ncbi:MAG: protein kinase [Chloroflexi bacterium]|nr:protein kinase [Chloroflexota bacterium]